MLDGRLPYQNIYPDRTRYVLELFLTQSFRAHARLVANLVVHGSRDANPARWRQCVDTRCYIHPVTENGVVGKHHVAEMDADTQQEFGILLREGLHLAGTVHR